MSAFCVDVLQRPLSCNYSIHNYQVWKADGVQEAQGQISTPQRCGGEISNTCGLVLHFNKRIGHACGWEAGEGSCHASSSLLTKGVECQGGKCYGGVTGDPFFFPKGVWVRIFILFLQLEMNLPPTRPSSRFHPHSAFIISLTEEWYRPNFMTENHS